MRISPQHPQATPRWPKNLRLRMLSYLKSPQLEQVRRESVLKQEEALADLDISIDDWLVKLEQVSLKPSLQ